MKKGYLSIPFFIQSKSKDYLKIKNINIDTAKARIVIIQHAIFKMTGWLRESAFLGGFIMLSPKLNKDFGNIRILP